MCRAQLPEESQLLHDEGFHLVAEFLTRNCRRVREFISYKQFACEMRLTYRLADYAYLTTGILDQLLESVEHHSTKTRTAWVKAFIVELVQSMI